MIAGRRPSVLFRWLDGASSWVARTAMERPESGRSMAVLVIVGTTLLIGVADFATGTRVSFGFFYFFPVILSAVWLGLRAGVLASLFCGLVRTLADLMIDPSFFWGHWIWWNPLSGVLVYLGVVWILDAFMRLHRELEQRVRERTAELEEETRKRQEVQRQLLELSANERSAMGRELHDQLGQHLVGTAMAAQVLAQRLHARGENGGSEARKIADLLEQGVAQTRQLAHGLLLTQIEPARLGAEFEELCATLRQQYPRVRCECRIDARQLLRDAGRAAQLFRIGQEALRNALRHAGARHVTLTLLDGEDSVILRVEDDGRGLPPVAERGVGLGLSIMRHRAEHLGTNLQVESSAGRGTCIWCRVPLEANPVRKS
jgi:signal transduction histidine kinase